MIWTHERLGDEPRASGKFLYAVRVDTSEGFQLCPADACQTEIGRAHV